MSIILAVSELTNIFSIWDKMKQHIFLLITILSIVGCGSNSKNGKQSDEFYTDKGGIDLWRVPLIKPYEIVTLREGDWGARSVDTFDVPLSMPGVRTVNVVDSVIFIFGTKTILNGQEVEAAWFVIKSKNHKVWGFKDHQNYLNHIHSIGIGNEPKLLDVRCTRSFPIFPQTHYG